MNSVASTLNRVTDMEFNNQISVLTQHNWNTWKHDMQVLLMHYGCWQFIIQTKPEQPDEEATYKETLDLQLRKDRCYTLIYTNISSDLKNLITETTDGVAAWKILKDHFEPVTRARVIQLLDQFFGTKYQPGEDVGIFISRVKTAATRLQEAGHKLDDLYIGFQLIRWLPQEFQSTVQQIYRWKEEDFRVVKIEAELILEANRLQLMKQDLEKAENAYLRSFTLKKSKTLPGATAAAHGDPNGKNDYQKRSGKIFNCKTIKNVKQSIKTIGPCYVCNKYGHLKVNCKEKKSLPKSPSNVNETFNTEFDKGVWVIDTAATSHFCNDKSLFLDLKPITNMKMSLATEDKSCPVEGIGTLRFRVKYKGSFHEITLTDVLFNPKLRRNLLSGSRLESKGAHFVGTKGKINVFNKNWIKLFSATRHEHLYFLSRIIILYQRVKKLVFSDVTAKTKNGSIEIWHQRFCHVNNDYLVKTSKNDSVKGLPRLTDNGKTHCIPCKLAKSKRVSFKKTGAVRSKRPLELLHMDLCGPMPTESQGGNKYFLSIIDDYSRKTKVNSNLGYNLNLPDYYDDEDDSDRVKDSLTSRLVSKTSTEMPSTSEKPDVSSDNHSLIPCTEVKWIRNIGRKVTGSNVYYSIEGEATRLKSFNEIERYCKRHNIKYDPSLFNFRKDNTESQGFSDLSEQQEALMVEVTIPNCYKQAIRSRDASKWHDAMDKEINVMKERKVSDLVDHPDNIKILENRWVYTIKYDENNKIVRYKARLVARGNTQLRGESFDEVFQEYQLELSKVKSLKLRCYSDSDFATNRNDRVSMGGFITFIDETPIS
ncbi:retrovirus-related Pol polyprotein from transposon TNT 1-94 [Trichonephila clavipes]|nr:retrovirus-related Pol polyprotein from transposon TNT 1-94 [Trichonephila clavipes]